MSQKACKIYVLFIGIVFSVFPQNATDVSLAIPPNLIPQLLALNGDLPTQQNPRYLSPVASVASPDGKYIYIAEQQMKQVAQLDCRTNKIAKIILVPNEPTGIAVSRDGSTIFVTCASDRWASGIVCVIPVQSGKVLKRITAGHFARSPVLSLDGGTLYTCNWLGNDLSIIDLAAGVEKKRIPMIREPYGAALTPDGATLIVTNALTEKKATDTMNVFGKVSLVSTLTGTVKATVDVLPVGTHSLLGCSVSNDGAYAFVTNILGKFTLPVITMKNGWVQTNMLGVIDIKNEKLINNVVLDNATQGYANPWSVAQTQDNKYLCVLHAGSHSMTVFDYTKLITIVCAGKDLSHNFDQLYPVKKTVSLQVKSPQSITMIADKAYITGLFSDSLQIVTVSSLAPTEKTLIAIGEAIPLNMERWGSCNFINADNCFQGWQTCFSCHPFGRTNAFNWMLYRQNAGSIERYSNSKSMVYAWWTPPTHWNGQWQHAGGSDGSIPNAFNYELEMDVSEEIAMSVGSFLMRMKPTKSPLLQKGILCAAALRGKGIFNNIGCSRCHPAPLYTDNQIHDIGVFDPVDSISKWDTPPLIEVWRTAPYSHSGCYNKIEEMVEQHLKSLGTRELSEREMKDLVEFISSL